MRSVRTKRRWRFGEGTEAGAQGDPVWRSAPRLMRVTTIDRAGGDLRRGRLAASKAGAETTPLDRSVGPSVGWR